MSSNPSNAEKFTPKELEEIASLKETINSRGSSRMEKDIAGAKLDALEASKAPPPHMHRHRLHGVDDEEGTTHNLFHNDEAFERFEMGGDQPHGKSSGSKVHNQAAADYRSVKSNHKARGTVKEKAEDTLHEEM
ncbi:hypothetical protein BDZ97DRAFT_1757649 [Flammula alnicola]|nr:hypothetical protein BDZ97DRAFT_1757649 [Flammula alnicola]